jgi:hypothetical protein
MQSLPDSGERTAFDTGAVRDSGIGKGFPSLVPTCALESIARRFEDGALKYDRDNWKKGIPLSRFYDSAFRHLLSCRDGHTDEDHFGAVLWNVSCWLWTKEKIEQGKLPKYLNDLDYE